MKSTADINLENLPTEFKDVARDCKKKAHDLLTQADVYEKCAHKLERIVKVLDLEHEAKKEDDPCAT